MAGVLREESVKMRIRAQYVQARCVAVSGIPSIGRVTEFMRFECRFRFVVASAATPEVVKGACC